MYALSLSNPPILIEQMQFWKPPQPQLQPQQVRAAAKKQQGGFDCEFTHHPPETVQAECPVCLLVLREPYQVSCCGYTFCQTCIERVQLRKTACPTCNVAEFSVFEDKRLKRSLYSYRVWCSHEKEGCQWTGELGELDKHLNENPILGRQFVGCELVEVECNDCGKSLKRRHFKAHQLEQHPFNCQYCHDYESYYEDVVKNHWPECGCRPVPCPNECGVYPERQNFDHHLSKDCPLTVVNCDFHYAGCEVQLPRKDMPAHLAENLVAHMAHLLAYTEKTLAEKDQQITQLRSEMEAKLEACQRKIHQLETGNKTQQETLSETTNRLRRTQSEVQKDLFLTVESLKREVAELRSKQEEDSCTLRSLQSHIGVIPIDFTMTEFRKHRKRDEKWFSEPFYTHTRGYKMCLCVYANGVSAAKGTYVSVYGHIMKGPFDDHLKWPFRGDITLQLVNQIHDEGHLTHIINFSTADASRVTTGERAESGWGISEFLPHNELGYDRAKNRHFFKDDCLCFRVLEVMRVSDIV